MLCINLSVCSFVKAEKYGPNPPNHIQKSNNRARALQKIPFYVFHRCVNVVTWRCHSERSHQAAGPESTPLIGGQLVLLKGDWQTENCTLRFHPSFVAVVLPLVNSPPCLRQTEALSISCWLGGWVGRLRRDGGGDGGRKTILHLSTLRENQSCHHKWEVWMNFISWFLSCSRRWLSDWPVPLIGILNDP